VTIDPEVLAEAKRQAAQYGHSLSHVVEELLWAFIETPEEEAK
jgi:hypothetical protein